MYTLRVVEVIYDREEGTKEGIVSNHELGCAYSKIDPKSKRFKDLFPEATCTDELIMLISGFNGVDFFVEKSTPDHQRDYYIVSESGVTFERLS